MTGNNINQENDLILKTIKWCEKTFEEIYKAGGNPTTVFRFFNEDLIITMVRNNLYIKFES